MTRTEAMSQAQATIAIINANAASIDLPEGYSVKTDISEAHYELTLSCSVTHDADKGLEPLSYAYPALHDAIISGFEFDDAICENSDGQVFDTVSKTIDFD